MDKNINNSIRFKIIMIISICIIFLSAVIYFYSSDIFKKSFALIEKKENINNVELINNTIHDQLSSLSTKLIDWAYWDDTHVFIKDKNKAYIESNLGIGSISNLKINSIVYINTENKIVYKKTIDFNSKEEFSSDDLEGYLLTHNDLMYSADKSNTQHGIIMLPKGPMLVSAAPILNSDSKGGVRGKLIFAKYLDSNLVNEIGKSNNLPISIYPFNGSSLPPDVSFAKNAISNGEKVYLSQITSNMMGAYTVLNDFHNKPALILKAETSRHVYTQGLNNLNNFLTAAMSAVLLFGIIIYIFIEIFFIYRFSRLTYEVQEIGKIKNFSFRVTEGQKDGIGSVAIAINGMLDKLYSVLKSEEKNREDLKESEQKLKTKVDDLEKTQKAVSRLVEDLEKEKKISELTAEELKKFKLVIDNTSEHIIITDTEGIVIYANPAVESITGYSHEEVIGAKPSLWGQQMSKEFYEEMWHTIKKDKRTFSGEIINKRKNGDLYTAKSMISPILNDDGEIEFYVGVELDISKEKALELALIEEKKNVDLKVIERTKELKEERARLLSSINSIPFGFIIADSKNNIIMKNNAMMDIFHFDGNKNISLDDMVGFFDKDFNLKVKIEQCSKSQKVCELDEISLNDKIFRGIIAPIIITENNDNIGYVLLLEDITEEKILERSKDEFFAVASHELRTPLAAIRGNSSMLLDLPSEHLKDKDANEMLLDINEASKRLIGIVNDFLDASRLEQGKIEIVNNKFDLFETINKTVKSVEELASSKNLGVEFIQGEDKMLEINADKGKVEQILLNLIGNGIKFTKAGKIVVTTSVESNFVKISVSDTGPGISSKNETLLFRKFQPAGEHILTRDVTKSTGLGLYISRMLVSKMGGTIGLEKSVVGEGSTFFFTVPIDPLI